MFCIISINILTLAVFFLCFASYPEIFSIQLYFSFVLHHIYKYSQSSCIFLMFCIISRNILNLPVFFLCFASYLKIFSIQLYFSYILHHIYKYYKSSCIFLMFCIISINILDLALFFVLFCIISTVEIYSKSSCFFMFCIKTRNIPNRKKMKRHNYATIFILKLSVIGLSKEPFLFKLFFTHEICIGSIIKGAKGTSTFKIS